MDPKTCTITLVQFTETSEQDEVLARMRPFFESAVAQGSDLIVFPEYTLSAGQGRVIAPDHDNVKGFCKLADAFNINAVAGLVEAYGESYATTALTVDRNGKIIGRYLKMHAAAGVGEHCWPPISDTLARHLKCLIWTLLAWVLFSAMTARSPNRGDALQHWVLKLSYGLTAGRMRSRMLIVSVLHMLMRVSLARMYPMVLIPGLLSQERMGALSANTQGAKQCACIRASPSRVMIVLQRLST